MSNPTMVNSLKVALFSLQDTFGTKTDTSAMTSADYIDVQEGAEIAANTEMEEITSLQGKWSQPKQVAGGTKAEVTLPMVMRSDYPGVGAGYWSDPIQCCCFKETESSNVYSYEPTSIYSEWKDGTFWSYSGNLTTSGALVQKAHNLMGGFEISVEPGKTPKIDFKFEGAYTGPDIDATQPTCTRASNAAPEAIAGATVSIHGYGYKLLESKIKAELEVDATKDISKTYLYGHTLPRGLKCSWTAKVYAITVANDDPFIDLLDGTLGAFSLSWGSTGNIFTISSPNDKCQITSRKLGDENGIQTLELEGIFADNDLKIEVDTNS